MYKKMNEITISDIIERHIEFIKFNEILDEIEYKDINEGQLLAYNEMLQDIKLMNEKEFADKYFEIINVLKIKFENEEIVNDSEIEKMSAYNNAIVSILIFINPIYEYDIN